VLLPNPQLVRLVDDEVGLEGHVEGEEDAEVGQQGDVAQLESPDPLQHPRVLVDDLALLEVEGLAGVLARHLDEGLVQEGRVVDILLQFKQPVQRSAEEFRVAQSVSHVLVLLLGFDGNVVLIALAVVVVAGDWTVESLLLPLQDVLEGRLLVPDGVGHEAVLVGEGPHVLAVNIAAREAQVGQFLGGEAVGVEVGVDARDALLVGPVEFGDGVPDLSLHLEILLEVFDDCVIGISFGLVVVLVKLGSDIVGRGGVLVGQGRIDLVIEEGVLLEQLQILLLLGLLHEGERVEVARSAEAGHD